MVECQHLKIATCRLIGTTPLKNRTEKNALSLVSSTSGADDGTRCLSIACLSSQRRPVRGAAVRSYRKSTHPPVLSICRHIVTIIVCP